MMHRSVAYIYAPYMLFSSIAITYGVIIEGAVVPSNGIHYHYHIRREYIHVFLHVCMYIEIFIYLYIYTYKHIYIRRAVIHIRLSNVCMLCTRPT